MGEYKGYAQEELEFSLTFPEGKDEKFFETQTKSIIQYNELLSNLTLENKSVIWSRGVTVNQGSTGKASYNECYGGAYLNEAGELVVMLTNNSYQNKRMIRNYTGDAGILTVPCKYSYNELTEVIDRMNENWLALLEQGVTLSSMYRDMERNCVVLNVRELNEEKLAKIKEVVDSEILEIQNTEECIEPSAGVIMKGGMEIKNERTGGS